MADSNRAVSIRKNLQKHAGRAKELFRQNLGKADKTTDEKFEEYVKNFGYQMQASARLVKEVRNYNNCLKALQLASKSLMDLVCELYEPNWVDHDKVQVKSELLEKKWGDLHSTIEEQVEKPLVSYFDQFGEVSNKISKRRRKLIDFDSSRHDVQNLEQHRNKEKKKEEAKLQKAREQMEEKQLLYETINSELMIELPALWDSRIAFLASNFQCLFVAESSFHSVSQRIFCDLNDVVESLASEHQKGIYAVKRCSIANESATGEPGSPEDTDYVDSGESFSTAKGSDATLIEEVDDDKPNTTEVINTVELDKSSKEVKSPVISGISESKEEKEESDIKKMKVEEKEDKTDESIIPKELPSDALRMVKATFHYAAEDSDELSFEPGEIIFVTEFEDPDQQEDGWLMGYKVGTDVKGLFPANFTKPI